MSGLFKNGINYTGAIPTAEEVPFDKTKHNIGDNVQEAIDWTYIRAKSASSDLEDYELQTDRKFFEFGQRMGENEESVRELNSNLTDYKNSGYLPLNKADKREFVVGSMNGQGQDTVSSTRVRSGYMKVKPDTTYSMNTNGEALVYEFHEYTSSKVFVKYTTVNATTGSVKVGNTTEFVRVLFRYSDNRNIETSAVDKFVIVEGESVPTTYIPYAPPNTEISALNESLADYGMNNVFDGVLKKGFYTDNGEYYATSGYTDMCTNFYSCNSNNIINIKYSKDLSRSTGAEHTIIVCFYNSSKSFISVVGSGMTGNTFKLNAPSNANYFTISFGNKTANLSENDKVTIYVNNAIDTLKSELTVIGASFTDFNDAKTQGKYELNISSAIGNSPSIPSTQGILEVISSGAMVRQIFWHSNGTVWSRVSWYSSWKGWKQLDN